MAFKKILSIVLAFALIIALLSVSFGAYAASYSGGCGSGVRWSFDASTGNFVISGNGKMKDYSDEDATGWESYKSSIKTVTVKSGVTSVGKRAFVGCPALNSITLADSVKVVGDYAFENCVALKKVSLGSGVTSIGSYSFRGCKSIESINLPTTLTSIGKYAFSDCYNLGSVAIPRNVTIIDDYAFAYCGRLKTVSFGASLTTIGVGAFTNTALASVTIPGNVKTIRNYAFSEIFNLTEVRLKNGVKSIGKGAFQYTSLSEITIPSSVASIGEMAVGYGMSGGKTDSFVISCYKNTAGYDYAQKHGFKTNLLSAALGDVNADGSIASPDALMILMSVEGSLKLTSEQKTAADVNKNNEVNSRDAYEILLFATEIISKF